MNKEYVALGKDLFVTNEHGTIKKVPNNGLSVKKLQLENDLEKLEEMHDKYLDSLLDNKTIIKSGFILGTIGLIVGGILSTLLLVIGGLLVIPLTLPSLFLIFVGFMNLYKSIKSKCESIKISQELVHIENLIQKANNEKKQLIKKEEYSDSLCKEGVINKFVDGPYMQLIERDFELIKFYQANKKKILEYYKNGCLYDWMQALYYNLEDINFVIILIEKDIEQKEEKGKCLIKK